MMSEQEFNEIYPKTLTPKQHDVLDLFLTGKSDEEIMQSMGNNDQSTVRSHITKICTAFGYKNEPGEHYSFRPELIALFVAYKPELVPKLLENGKIGDGGPIENDYRDLLQPWALIRIEGSRQTGKTTLMNRILEMGKKNNYQTVYLTLRLADEEYFNNLEKFLRWFCTNISNKLKVENKLNDYWNDEDLGNKDRCTKYFEEYILTQVNEALVLGIDDLHGIFDGTIALDFFGLLRSWHDDKTSDTWGKLRLVLAYNQDIEIPRRISESPLFNAGTVVKVPEFNPG